jgi:hypothetical protein
MYLDEMPLEQTSWRPLTEYLSMQVDWLASQSVLSSPFCF